MLAIRLRRTGKTHTAAYRIIVQEAQKQPTSGKVVAFVGAYNPHSKEVSVNIETAQKYLDNGAQPTPRVAKLLKENGIKLPSWVREFDGKGARKARNPEKLRKNQPKEEKPAEESLVEDKKDAESTESPESSENLAEQEIAEKPTE
jgi:small subunit ribosomal protein S16